MNYLPYVTPGFSYSKTTTGKLYNRYVSYGLWLCKAFRGKWVGNLVIYLAAETALSLEIGD